jgi:ABC-type dipeptide/oligopeptide/nickel transport system ATPase component
MSLTTVTTLSDPVEVASGTNAKGAWKLLKLTGGDGRDYTTFDGNLASKAAAAEGALRVEYEEVAKQKDGRTFTDYKLKDVEPTSEAPVAAPAQDFPKASKGEFRTPLQIQRVEGYRLAFETFIAIGQDPILSLNEVFQYGEQITDALMNGVEITTEG